MKKYIFVIILILSLINGYSQEDQNYFENQQEMEKGFNAYLELFSNSQDFRDRPLKHINELVEKYGVMLVPLIDQKISEVDFFHVNDEPYNKSIILSIYLISKLERDGQLSLDQIKYFQKQVENKLNEYIQERKVIDITVLDGVVCLEMITGKPFPFRRPLILSGKEIKEYFEKELKISGVKIISPVR